MVKKYKNAFIFGILSWIMLLLTIGANTSLAMSIPNTLNIMNDYDYISNSVTGISDSKVSASKLQRNVANIGTLYGVGMPYKEYKEAMDYKWEDCTVYDRKPDKINIDITKGMKYHSYVSTLQNLSRYEGVYLYKIGESTEGRAIYAIEIDIPSEHTKDVIMLTGQIHAREFAGGTYIVKQFVDLIQKAQTDKTTMEMLKKHKFVAVPIINVDGREKMIQDPGKWTTKEGEMWKAYVDGTDGNRNFPGLLWGQVNKGNKLRWSVSLKPGYANYAGAYAGSSNETKAMMKWLYHYVAVEQAVCLLDLHQQGSVIYAGKGWQTKEQTKRSTELRSKVFKLLNQGNVRTYGILKEESKYGFEGTGSTLTDFAVSVAVGAKFSPAFGFYALSDGKREYMMMEVIDLDNITFELKEVNPNFATLTIEIGKGIKYLGNSVNARKLLADEYNKYHFNRLLESVPEMIK